MSDDRYGFEDVPLDTIRPGTTVLLAGPSHAGTRELGLRLLAGREGEGAILVTTNRRSRRIAADCERAGLRLAADSTAILDCVGGEDSDVPAQVLPVSGPSDLTGIGMRYSDVHREFARSGIDRIRTGLFSLSTLLSFGDLKTVSRFVHTLVGRIDSLDGLGVLVVDPAIHDDATISTLSQFCAGRIDVREGDDGPELRARGLPSQSRDWRGFDLAWE
ncbi:DUF7504 family protein [Halolamina rubra]|uniref:DUF7504 family protein n=1 Tax=Halolamina rubra TaxID=1380430 RepID=UPI000679CE92|nr:hypothetical protein [Halolamina rubra]